MTESYTPIFTRFAEDDLLEILDFYSYKNPSFIPKLVKMIDERLEDLKFFPMKGRIVPELESKSITDYRELIEGYYRIIYHIRNKDVYVLSIIDGRRNIEELLLTKLMRK